MKNLFRRLYVFLTIFYRLVIYGITKRKLVIDHVYIDAPIGINGQPNKITWNIQNLIYAKVITERKKRSITQNEFHFTNDLSTSNFKIIFYGIKEKAVKTFDLHFLDVEKLPPPEPIFKKEFRLYLKSEFKNKNVLPSLKTPFALKPSKLKFKGHIPQITDVKIEITPLVLDELSAKIREIDNEQDIDTLTKTIKNEKRLLPQPDPRPYHEVIMESRWFG